MATTSKFRAQSRESIDKLVQKTYGLSTESSREVSTELFALLDYLHENKSVLSLWTSASYSSEQRQKIVEGTLSHKVSTATVDIVATAVSERWSSSDDVLRGLHHVANVALLTNVQKEEKLDQVRDELLSLSQLIKSNKDIEQDLTNKMVSVKHRKEWFTRLIDTKVSEPTKILAVNAIGVGLPGDSLAELASSAAHLNKEKIAYVTTSAPLSAEQSTQIATRLSSIYGTKISIAPIVDPRIIGGAIARVEYDIIDASISGKLRQAMNNFS